jgi:hypothetical protein
VQNVNEADPPRENVQHSLFEGSAVQSPAVWHKMTDVVSVQLVPRCVVQVAAQDVPTVAGVQEGYVPCPSVVSTPQQSGVAPEQSSGPAQTSWFADGQAAFEVHANVLALGMAQHTSFVSQAWLAAHGKSYVALSAPVAESTGLTASGVWPESTPVLPESSARLPVSVVLESCVLIPESAGGGALDGLLLLHPAVVPTAMTTTTSAGTVLGFMKVSPSAAREG